MKGTIAVMVKPGKLEYQQYDLPTPEKGALLLKIIRTNVCGSELHTWNGSNPGRQSGPLGHEMLGEIVALGEGVNRDYAGNLICIGDRITATYFKVCGRCFHCANGEFLMCENTYESFWAPPEKFPHFSGTFATHYYLYPEQYFYKVPDNIPDAVAASANCAISQVLYGIEQTGLKMYESVVIQGAGGLGLYGTAIAKEIGAKTIVIDGVKARLEQAKKFGADYVIDLNEYDTVDKRTSRVMELTNGRGADVGIEVAGVPDAFSEGIKFIRPCGRYVTMGNIIIGKLTQFDPSLLIKRQIVIYPINRYQAWYLKKSLEFLSINIDKYPFAELMDAEFTFDEIEEALNKSLKREVTRASIVVG